MIITITKEKGLFSAHLTFVLKDGKVVESGFPFGNTFMGVSEKDLCERFTFDGWRVEKS